MHVKKYQCGENWKHTQNFTKGMYKNINKVPTSNMGPKHMMYWINKGAQN